MKRENPENKLAFNKAVVTELNANQLENVNGGTSSFTVGTTSLILVTIQTVAAE